jgi:hypothetical protein
MKTSIAVATLLLVGAGATGAAALPNPYQGSDTLFNVTTQAIAAAGLTPSTAYVGGGSGNGQSAMDAKTQQTSPMSRMINNGGGICTFNGGAAGSADTSASTVVIGLDAVDVLASTTSGASTACNGTADNTGTGLAFSGSAVFADPNQTWKYVLALVYGGKDITTGVVDCNQTARATLVNNWSSLFQNGCANGASVCGDATHSNVLWHAFRRDDASGTSDVFASVLGLSPSTSASSNNGFGASPYCNALNWDVSTANASCALGANKQFTGPGGILDPVAADGVHRRPPPGTWGDAPDPASGSLGADVLPTSLQDNDPIRRACIGTTVNNHARSGEEVCNIDGKLGLVLPIPTSDFIPKENPGLVQYPSKACNTFVLGKPTTVFTCAIRGTGTKHSGECPNGDALFGGSCSVPVDSVDGTSQCVSGKSTVASLVTRSTLGSPDGRAYNAHMRDGTVVDGSVGYVEQKIPTATTTLSLDFVGGYGRIHQVETIFATGGTAPTACQLSDATDEIGCLVQADPCSIGYAGDSGKTWGQRAVPAVASDNDALRVSQIAPTVTTVQLLGKTGEYQLARKLYFASLIGFGNIADTATDTSATDELALGKFESVPGSINPILTSNGFFTLGPLSPEGTDTQFCEDFNEQTVCGNAGNLNACNSNPAGIPGDPSPVPALASISTVCGNGNVESYEECDHGSANGASGNACSSTCRCVGAFPCQ